MKLLAYILFSSGAGNYAFQRKCLPVREKKKKERKKRRKDKGFLFLFMHNKESYLEALLSLILIFSLTYLA